jgi:hypothetical protein
MRELAQEELDPQNFYRANRCDIPSSIDEAWSFDEQLAFCGNNIIRRLGYDTELLIWAKYRIGFIDTDLLRG